jgi:hypothetical protein
LSQKIHKYTLAKGVAEAYIIRMETPQETYFRKHGYYSHMMRVPTKEEALQHAMNAIERALGKKN